MGKHILYIIACLAFSALSLVNSSKYQPSLVEVYKGDENVGFVNLCGSTDRLHFSFTQINFDNSNIYSLTTHICDNTFSQLFGIDSSALRMLFFGNQIVAFDSSSLYTYAPNGALKQKRFIGNIGREPIVADSFIYYCENRSVLIQINAISGATDTLLTSFLFHPALNLREGETCKIESFDVYQNELACALKVVYQDTTKAYIAFISLINDCVSVKPIKSRDKSLNDAKFYDDICIRYDCNKRLFGIFDSGKNNFEMCDFTQPHKAKKIYSFPPGLNISNFISIMDHQFVISASNDLKRNINYSENPRQYFKWFYSWSSIYKLNVP